MFLKIQTLFLVHIIEFMRVVLRLSFNSYYPPLTFSITLEQRGITPVAQFESLTTTVQFLLRYTTRKYNASWWWFTSY